MYIKKLQSKYKLGLSLIIILFSIHNLFGQIHSSTSAHTTFNGLSMTGYQGWFGTPDDGITNSWRHYGSSGAFRPGYASIEYSSPIEIQSDSAEIDHKNGLAIYTGQVLMKQEKRTLESNKLTIYKGSSGNIHKVIEEKRPHREMMKTWLRPRERARGHGHADGAAFRRCGTKASGSQGHQGGGNLSAN